MTFDALFAMTPAGPGTWIGPATPRTSEPRVFGGVLIGQAIVAASAQTQRCHALHAFFIGVGEMQAPFNVSVEKIRDGGSFATRRIDIRQDARLLLTGHTSHHDGDDGPEGHMAMPDVPSPETLQDQRVMRVNTAVASGKPVRRYLAEELLDIRPTPPAKPMQARAVWFRPRTPIEGGDAIHQAAMGFASDSGLVHVGLRTYAQDIDVQAASLDHNMWFHRAAFANAWMLHVQTAPSMSQGRGFSQASIFTRDGVLVASVAQEFLARRKKPVEERSN